MWDERYGDDEYAYGKEPNDFLAAMISRLPRGKILCLCDGEGRNDHDAGVIAHGAGRPGVCLWCGN